MFLFLTTDAYPTHTIPTTSSPANGSAAIPQHRPDTEGISRATSAHRAKMTGRTNTGQKLTIGEFDSVLNANLSDPVPPPWAMVLAGPAPSQNETLLADILSSESGCWAVFHRTGFGFYSCPSGEALSWRDGFLG